MSPRSDRNRPPIPPRGATATSGAGDKPSGGIIWLNPTCDYCHGTGRDPGDMHHPCPYCTPKEAA